MPNKENEPKSPDEPKSTSNLFPVVGIGASAGGLEAFKDLLKAIPLNSGMAYILVQHLAPEHESALPEILQRVTKIPVVEIKDDIKIVFDHIYIIPPNKLLFAADGVLKLGPRLADKVNMPIDIFLSSLAEVHQGYAIGVILSGTGRDGTTGLKDIKDNGGLTFAQDLDSAAYEGMPQNAIASEVVDFILPPGEIPGKLLELKQAFTVSAPEDELLLKDKTNEEAFRQILALLRVRLGVDFSFYKQTTIRRRIVRRMVMLKLENVTDYLYYLKKNKQEYDILFNDLLIQVTSFFRDPKTFDLLGKTVFHEITKNKSTSNPLRLWVAGCCTGQEAYSTAIILHEYLNDHVSNIKVQIFASDISDKSIKKARTGIYTKKEVEGVSESRLHQFFNKTNGHYQVKKAVRDMCVFATHNFLKDPPFAKMDMISCRNVLIYFEPFLQKKVFTIFHYALRDKGVLWLGKSETAGQSSDLFIPFGGNEKFYARKSVPGRFTNVISERSETAFTDRNDFLRGKEGKSSDFQKSADTILLSKYTPAGVVVNDQFDIVQFRGATGKFLEPSPGKASLNVLKMANDSLSFEIRNALHKAKTTGEPIVKEAVPLNDEKEKVTIEVIPLLDIIDLHFLILFRNEIPIASNQPKAGKGRNGAAKGNPDEKDILIEQLRKELAQAREDMRGITEEQEAANEELQSSNEELLSGSEELQSLNEELETSKEELQSTNEELITVNQELFDSNEEMHSSRRFADTTIAILHEPLLVLDKKFIIKSANHSFYKTFQLTEDETLGKVLFELQDNGWNIPGLRKELEKIQNKKEKMIEVEQIFLFPDIGERIICFNIQPVNRESGEQLILLALDDVTFRKNAALILAEKAGGVLKERRVLNNFFMQTPAILCILKGPEHIFEFANPLYQQYTGNRAKTGQKLLDAIPELIGQGYLAILDKVYSTGEPFTGKEMPLTLENIKGKAAHHFIDLNYQAFKNEEGITEGILVFAYDVTERVVARQQLEVNAEMIQNLYMNAPGFICTLMGPAHIYTLVNSSYQKLFGKRRIVGKPIMEALPELEGQGFDKILDHVYESGETYVGIEIPITLAHDEGLLPEERYFNFSYQPIYQENKQINGVLVFGYEVTEEMRGKKIQQESAERFRILTEAMPQKVWITDPDGRVNYFNEKWLQYTQKSFEELREMGWKNMIHPDEWAENQQTWQRAMNTGEDFQVENRYLRHDGNYRWHLSRALPQKDINGEISMWLGTDTDIHEQKLFAEELEKQIAERVKLEKQKNDFISMASHELKTPVTSIKGYAQTLQRKFKNNGNTEDEAYLLKMDKQINKLTSLINDLLDATKVSAGQLTFNEDFFDFNELAIEIVAEMQQTTERHAINVKLDTSVIVPGDRNRIGQVMTNMLSNAIKYSPKADNIMVTSTQDNSHIKFCVQDFGIGIPQENKVDVFDQFFRVKGLLQDRFAGLGLGLFIASEILKRHHGVISVESVEGKGSTFCFTLPINKI